MSKVHLIAVEERITWPADGKEVICLCQKTVKDAMPVLDFDLREGHIESARTIQLCSECLLIGLSPVSGKRYIYGVLPREAALKANRGSEEL